jgi:hypothetical protein
LKNFKAQSDKQRKGEPMTKKYIEWKFKELISLNILLLLLYLLADYGIFSQIDYMGRLGYGFAWTLVFIYPVQTESTILVFGFIGAILNFPLFVVCLLTAVNLRYFNKLRRDLTQSRLTESIST